jgi:hypothetical protein
MNSAKPDREKTIKFMLEADTAFAAGTPLNHGHRFG